MVARLEAWRRAALRRAPEEPAAAAEPIRLPQEWLPHWTVDAVAAGRALRFRCGVHGGSSRLLERFPCRPVVALPVSALLELRGVRFDAALAGAAESVRDRAMATGLDTGTPASS